MNSSLLDNNKLFIGTLPNIQLVKEKMNHQDYLKGKPSISEIIYLDRELNLSTVTSVKLVYITSMTSNIEELKISLVDRN